MHFSWTRIQFVYQLLKRTTSRSSPKSLPRSILLIISILSKKFSVQLVLMEFQLTSSNISYFRFLCVKNTLMDEFSTSRSHDHVGWNQILSGVTSQVKQELTKSFYETLECFKEYTTMCPNHDVFEENHWNIFYHGIDYKSELSLNTPSNENIMTKPVTLLLVMLLLVELILTPKF